MSGSLDIPSKGDFAVAPHHIRPNCRSVIQLNFEAVTTLMSGSLDIPSKGDFAVAPLSGRFDGPSTPSHSIELWKCNTA